MVRDVFPRSEILLFGGRNRPHPQGRPESDWFEQAVLLRVRDGKVVGRLEYENREDASINVSPCFRAATIRDGRAYTCTGTEVIEIDLASSSITARHTNRFFNDLHHVTLVEGHYFVASTGTDSVVELDENFDLVRRYSVANDEILARYGADADFRKIRNTKPHMAHPNFVEAWAGEVWVTNFQYGRVESLKSAKRYVLSEHRVHDGIPTLGRIWFTSVNGAVIKLQPETGAIERHDLVPMAQADRLLGWCRGIAPISETDVLVGFSKLRETKVRENLKWIGNKLLGQDFKLSLPTRIARYDLARRTEIWRLDLHEHGMDAVFSIHIL